MIQTKSGAAALSIASNALLIAIKLAAGAITGSIAILTEAIHSLIDLVASVVAFVSVRKAGEPADADHPYGHEKVENLAATIEGLLILLGAAIIVYEATHRLVVGASVDSLGVGIAVMAIVEVTGNAAFDSITALVVAAAIVSAGVRIVRRSSGALVDEALPDEEMDRIEAAIAAARTAEVAGYHKLRARRAGSRRYIDLHVQYRSGTSLERAHELAHAMRDEIETAIPHAEVLIHAEPETSLRDPERARSGPFRAG
jgi:divalent metal cation (Fe/Co/Zn/Cd) transporter